MTDSHLRELERRWKETGSHKDEAAYLRERVRVGELSQEKLELAAYCGHEAAVLATGADPVQAPEDLLEWLMGLMAWGGVPLGQVLATAARQLLPAWEKTFPRDTGLRRALDLLPEVIADPTPDNVQGLRRLTEQIEEAVLRSGVHYTGPTMVSLFEEGPAARCIGFAHLATNIVGSALSLEYRAWISDRDGLCLDPKLPAHDIRLILRAPARELQEMATLELVRKNWESLEIHPTARSKGATDA